MKKYSIVVFLENKAFKEVRELQEKMFELTGSRACLDTWKPHFTVGDGISVTNKELETVEATFLDFVKTQKPFEVVLSGFGGKTDRKGGDGEITTPYVLWINVQPNEELLALVRDIQKRVTLNYDLWYSMPQPYTPHVTIAFRDLTKAGHSVGAKYLEQLDFDMTARASHVALVEKLPHTDKEYKHFIFRG